MQIDAHADFMQGYDVALQKMWTMTENEYGVLSTYVGNLGNDMSASGEVLVGLNNHEIPVLCGVHPVAGGIGRNDQAAAASCLTKPALAFTWAAGQSFAKCHFERNVPNDPYFENMF